MRRISIVTATRAEYGLLKPLINALSTIPGFQINLIITGTHLSIDFGNTVSEIDNTHLHRVTKIPVTIGSRDILSYSKGISELSLGLAEAWNHESPDLLIILGDRYELLTVAQIATLHRIPIAHIHGGEITEGAIDDGIRHALTKLSHLHFVASNEYEKRVRQLGESSANIEVVGALGLDNVYNLKIIENDVLLQSFGVPLGKEIFLVTYHPETQSDIKQSIIIRNILNSFLNHDCIVLVTGTNSDPGYVSIKLVIESYVKKNPEKFYYFPSLGVQNYLNFMRIAIAVVGNSSSGIFEAPPLKTPTINVGTRQNGRLLSSSVIQSDGSCSSLSSAIKRAKVLKYHGGDDIYISPYGSGRASEKIVSRLMKHGNFRSLLFKKFNNLEIVENG